MGMAWVVGDKVALPGRYRAGGGLAGEVVGVEGPQHVRVAWLDGLTSTVRADVLEVPDAEEPTWAEVTVSEVLAERDALRGERDRARALAVRLEQELSKLQEDTAWIDEVRALS